MDKVKGIPYGVASFEQLRKENAYYVDKTMYLPIAEEMNNYLFLIRPRRFGKSVFVSMMRAYYDIARAGSFDALFEGLWIHEHPTPLKNAFQIVYFDFSLIGVGDGMADLSRRFNSYCGMVLDLFADTYAKYYGEGFAGKVKGFETASDKLNYINLQAHEKAYPLYLIIDEYDNFTNVILSEGGTEMFRKLTHASGFYREYFKIFKVMFSRVFLIGVSPVTLDDLSSGYNIDWNISQDPRFNHMLGFSESEVREMFRYYQAHGKLRAEADIEGMMAEMKPWYNNYCFAEECLGEDRLYNCDMVYYYLRHQVSFAQGNGGQEHPDGLQEIEDAGGHRPGQQAGGPDERDRGDSGDGFVDDDAEDLVPGRIRDRGGQLPEPTLLLRPADNGRGAGAAVEDGDTQLLREGAVLGLHAGLL